MGLVTGSHARTPRAHRKGAAGPGRLLQETGGQGTESAGTWATHTGTPGAPARGALVPAPQRAKLAPQTVRCGVGDAPPCPHSPRPRKKGQRAPVPCPEDGRSEEGECPITDTPQRHQGSPIHTGPPPLGRTTRSEAARRGDRANAQHIRQAELGTRAGNAEGHRPPGTALPALYTGSARGARVMLTRGGGALTAGVQAHTHTTDTLCAPEGQPDRARGTHRPY